MGIKTEVLPIVTTEREQIEIGKSRALETSTEIFA